VTDWNNIATGPTDGTEVQVSDGEHIWLSSRKHSQVAPTDHQPWDGHDWYIPAGARYPTHWRFKPELPHD
jgi:hypothetical protein